MATPHTIEEALERFDLIDGAGSETEGKACVMTALSWVAGEAWSDHPQCAHNILANIAIRANDAEATTPEQRAGIVRAGETGIIDTWWLPGEVIAAAQIVPGDGRDTRTPVQKCLDVLGAVTWWKADKQRPELADANLADANLAGAYLADAYLADANLAGANLAGAYLTRANLTRANLAGAYLADADLARANLTRANLADANLAGAYLADAYLADANLTRANLTRANLAGAYLADAYLADANLAGAYLADAYVNKWTVLPEGCGWTVTDGRIVKAGA